MFLNSSNCVACLVKMNGKMNSETGAFSSDGMRAEILNPFVHKLEIDNTYDKIKVRNNCYEYVLNDNVGLDCKYFLNFQSL